MADNRAGSGDLRFVTAAALKEAAAKIETARMTATGVQPQTFAGRDVEVHVTEHVAIKGDGRGGTDVQRFEVRALFDRQANPVLRLANHGLITGMGALAAFTFAAAGDRVLGAVRVRTVKFEKERVLGGQATPDVEKDERARQRWNQAAEALSPQEFDILNRVMRYDESTETAARAAYPCVRAKMKAIGMGDQALIEGCAKLADAYGFETRKTAQRALAGL